MCASEKRLTLTACLFNSQGCFRRAEFTATFCVGVCKSTYALLHGGCSCLWYFEYNITLYLCLTLVHFLSSVSLSWCQSCIMSFDLFRLIIHVLSASPMNVVFSETCLFCVFLGSASRSSSVLVLNESFCSGAEVLILTLASVSQLSWWCHMCRCLESNQPPWVISLFITLLSSLFKS